MQEKRKLELSLDKSNNLNQENERNCFSCKSTVEKSSLEIGFKTEINNEEVWTCICCETKNSNDKILCENCAEKRQKLIAISKKENFMLKTIEKNQRTLDFTPNPMGESKEHTPKGKNTRLRSSSSNPNITKGQKEIKKPCLENKSLWKCLLCF